MAASMKKGLTFCCLRFHRLSSFGSSGQYVSRKAKSSSSTGESDSSVSKFRVGLSEDESTVISWHPEPKFPYEHTQPLPRRDHEIREGDSVLKVQHVRDHQLRFREEGPTVQELANLFHTSKHIWFNKSSLKKYKSPIKLKDRERI